MENLTNELKESKRYLENLYAHHTIKELKAELDFFLNRGYCANNTNQDEFNLQIQVLKNLLDRISTIEDKKEDKKELTYKGVNLDLNTIKTELKEYILNRISDSNDWVNFNIKEIIKDNELHHELFNTDYYIIGTYKAKEWLKEHNICAFDVCEYIKGYEIDNFGESTTDLSSPEKVVNMLVYIVGEQIIYNMENEILETIKQ